MATVYKQAVQLGFNYYGNSLFRLRSFDEMLGGFDGFSLSSSNSSRFVNRFECFTRHISSHLVKFNRKRLFLVDTLALGHHFSLLQHETEKLRGDIEKMCSELRYEIDKVTAGQRLDLNLERGRIRDELTNQNAETTNLTTKLDREIHGLRAQLEAGKYEVIKYCIGTLVSISAVGLAVLRILL